AGRGNALETTGGGGGKGDCWSRIVVGDDRSDLLGARFSAVKHGGYIRDDGFVVFVLVVLHGGQGDRAGRAAGRDDDRRCRGEVIIGDRGSARKCQVNRHRLT